MLKEYEINSETLAIMPWEENSSEVLEKDQCFSVGKTPKGIIEDSCEYYGSSYEGRLRGTKQLTGYNYKSPIIVEESLPTIFFPTESPRQQSCMWINLKMVEKCEKTEYGTMIFFSNGEKIEVNISKISLENQINRAARLAQRLNDRKIVKK